MRSEKWTTRAPFRDVSGMQTTSIEGSRERRKSASPRIPVDLLVELCAAEEHGAGEHERLRSERALDSWNDVGESFTDSYDADGLDLSATGLRLRSAVLPDVGQRLRCRFDLPDASGADSDAGTKCEAEGRVVWSNDAGRHGEFGLRFESLSPSVESALARWAMDRGPSTLPGSEPAPEPMPSMAIAKPSVVAKSGASKIVAPKITPPATSSPSPAFGLARVRFDGVASAIEAEVSLRDETRMDVEQALPFFELGRLASVDADGSTERRRLEHVSLKIENGVPKLVLGFVAAPSSSAGTLAAPSLDADTASAESTMQDESLDALLARTIESEERIVEARSSSSGSWVTDESADDSASDADDALSDEPRADEIPKTRSSRESLHSKAKRALFGSAEDSLEDGDPQLQAQRRKKLDEVRRVLLDGDELPEAPASSAGQEVAARPAALSLVTTKARAMATSMKTSMGPALARFVAAIRTGWTTFIAAVGPRSKSAYAAVAAWMSRAFGFVAERLKDRAPRLGALFTRSATKEKRRSTAPHAAQTAAVAAPRRQQRASQHSGSHRTEVAAAAETSTRPRLPLRYVLLAVIALGAVGSLAYALGGGPTEAAPIVVPSAAAPSSDEASDETSTELAPVEPVVEAAALAPAITEPSTESLPLPATIPSEPSALSAPSTDEGRLPMPGYPSIGRASASGSATSISTSTAAAGLAALTAPSAPTAPAAPSPGPVTSGRAFGSERVDGGQTTALRMSLAPTTLEGQADPHGFTVTIRGALSLDRAAGIARANPAVDRASILNRGDHSVLDVRFVEGRSPSYRVEIRGESVDVVIGR